MKAISSSDGTAFPFELRTTTTTSSVFSFGISSASAISTAGQFLWKNYFFMYFTVHYSFRNWFQAVHLVSRQKTQSKPVCGGKKILNNCIKFASINFYIFHSSTPSFCEAFSGVSWLDRNAMHIIVKIVQFLFFYYFYDSKISWYIVNSQWCV